MDFLIAHTPDGVHVHQVVSDVEAERDALMLLAGMPEDYMSQANWSLHVAPGVPHPSLLQRIPADAGGVPLCQGCYRADPQS